MSANRAESAYIFSSRNQTSDTRSGEKEKIGIRLCHFLTTNFSLGFCSKTMKEYKFERLSLKEGLYLVTVFHREIQYRVHLGQIVGGVFLSYVYHRPKIFSCQSQHRMTKGKCMVQSHMPS